MRSTLPVAVEDAFALWLWLDARVTAFPTAARHGLGARMLDAALDTLDALVSATYAPRHSPVRHDALARANTRLAVLRLLLRGARERHHLSLAQHEHAAGLTLTLGRRIGVWVAHERRAAQP